MTSLGKKNPVADAKGIVWWIFISKSEKECLKVDKLVFKWEEPLEITVAWRFPLIMINRDFSFPFHLLTFFIRRQSILIYIELSSQDFLPTQSFPNVYIGK